MIFSTKLIQWYALNKRDLPWRNTKDPYKVWLSEIILQQTRVEQGLPYYNKFVETFPDVNQLAEASLDEVYKLWEGLGYYSRARNLHQAAKQVVEDFNGKFPKTYDGLITLKGVGDYTASAIASFCFNEPEPVLDGNVFRVISRLYGINDPINKASSRKVFKTVLYELIDVNEPADFNQAIMEFGATNCTPKKPHCEACPFNLECYAFNKNQVDLFPFKEKTKKSINRYFNYLLINQPDQFLIKQRTKKDIWQNLYEFPLIESKEIFESEEFPQNISVYKVSAPIKHVLSHQNIYAKFYQVEQVYNKEEFLSVNKTDLDSFALPKLIHRFLENYSWS